MFLVDTSVWIDFLRKKENPSIHYFLKIINENLPFGINSLIFQEVLQGANDEQSFKEIDDNFSSQRFFHFTNHLKSHREAAKIYFACRRQGITIRSTIDCLIAQTAIENKLTLIHNDGDYVKIQQIVPSLKLAP